MRGAVQGWVFSNGGVSAYSSTSWYAGDFPGCFGWMLAHPMSVSPHSFPAFLSRYCDQQAAQDPTGAISRAGICAGGVLVRGFRRGGVLISLANVSFPIHVVVLGLAFFSAFGKGARTITCSCDGLLGIRMFYFGFSGICDLSSKRFPTSGMISLERECFLNIPDNH